MIKMKCVAKGESSWLLLCRHFAFLLSGCVPLWHGVLLRSDRKLDDILFLLA